MLAGRDTISVFSSQIGGESYTIIHALKIKEAFATPTSL